MQSVKERTEQLPTRSQVRTYLAFKGNKETRDIEIYVYNENDYIYIWTESWITTLDMEMLESVVTTFDSMDGLTLTTAYCNI